MSGLGAARTTRVLLVDHEDSFVHTLASYVRTAGAEVTTMRSELARETLGGELPFDLALLSPGPAAPPTSRSETLD